MQQPPVMYCYSCGTRLPTSAAYCPACGCAVTGGHGLSGDASPENAQKRATWLRNLLVIGAATIVALVLVGSIVAYDRMDGLRPLRAPKQQGSPIISTRI